MISDDDDTGQASTLAEVKVNIMLPNAVSDADGVYVAFRLLIEGEKVPVPDELQILDELPPVTKPEILTNALLLQTVWLLPAVTMVGSCIITLVESAKLEHPLATAVIKYFPAFDVVAFVMKGFCAEEVKALGPVQL